MGLKTHWESSLTKGFKTTLLEKRRSSGRCTKFRVLTWIFVCIKPMIWAENFSVVDESKIRKFRCKWRSIEKNSLNSSITSSTKLCTSGIGSDKSAFSANLYSRSKKLYWKLYYVDYALANILPKYKRHGEFSIRIS